jgi:hypothetical protein
MEQNLISDTHSQMVQGLELRNFFYIFLLISSKLF